MIDKSLTSKLCSPHAITPQTQTNRLCPADAVASADWDFIIVMADLMGVMDRRGGAAVFKESCYFYFGDGGYALGGVCD